MKEIFIKKLIGKIFPEFSNKVTWTLITIGIAILAIPAPTYLLPVNFIIDVYNKKTDSDINLITIDSISPSNGVALTLIILGLVYHLAIKALQLYPEISNEKNKKDMRERKRAADIQLYEQFIEILPPTSLLIEFLKNHDFGISFHNNNIKNIDVFKYGWNHPDQHFHDEEIEKKSIFLYDEIMKFDNFLAFKSRYINDSILSILTARDQYMEMDWLPQTEENVNKANKWSLEIYHHYCDFISTCKNNLAI